VVDTMKRRHATHRDHLPEDATFEHAVKEMPVSSSQRKALWAIELSDRHASEWSDANQEHLRHHLLDPESVWHAYGVERVEEAAADRVDVAPREGTVASMDASATALQSWYRRMATKRRVARRRRQREQREAVQLQSVFRGFHVRRALSAALESSVYLDKDVDAILTQPPLDLSEFDHVRDVDQFVPTRPALISYDTVDDGEDEDDLLSARLDNRRPPRAIPVAADDSADTDEYRESLSRASSQSGHWSAAATPVTQYRAHPPSDERWSETPRTQASVSSTTDRSRPGPRQQRPAQPPAQVKKTEAVLSGGLLTCARDKVVAHDRIHGMSAGTWGGGSQVARDRARNALRAQKTRKVPAWAKGPS
jgi:hypothetical protein